MCSNFFKREIFSLKKIVPAALTPLMNANIAGLVMGAVWVGITMQWKVIGIGIVVVAFSPYFIPILMIPAGILSHFMIIYREKKQENKEQLMFVLSIFYILLFLTIWCVSILEFITTRVTPDAQMGGLIWTNAVAMLPLLMWINRDLENFFIMTLVESTQIAFLLLFTIKFAGIETSFWISSAIFGGFLSLVTILLAVNEKISAKNPQENSN